MRRFSSNRELFLCRMRMFYREPEAIFWTYGFPVLLTIGLGVAFRNRPPEVAKIAVVDPALGAALAADKSLSVTTLTREAAENALRTGRVVLMVLRDSSGRVLFRYDDTNPDANIARLLADRAVQQAAGARDPVPVSNELVREPGSRYIDFLVPGLLGMNLMGNGLWGLGFAIVDARRRKLLKRLIALPMPRWQYLLSFLLSRLVVLVAEVVVLVGFGRLAFGARCRSRRWSMRSAPACSKAST